MKHILIITACTIMIGIAGCDAARNLQATLQKGSPVTQSEAGQGIQEALIKGITNGTNIVSQLDGYFKNEAIKVLFPPEARKVEDALRKIGLGSQVDKAVLSMNRGAEEAAKEALPIFTKAIKGLTFQDALAIIRGDQNACTEYLKAKTTADLTAAFKPVIARALDKVSATKYWSDIMGTYNKIPLVDKVNTDLPAYVTDRAINGLFHMIEQEERSIRTDPVARTTELLRRVFGS